MKKIKKRYRWLKKQIDDAFGNPMIYDYQRTLIKLTIIVLIAVFIVIRGSTAPLLLDNSIMRFLFYTPIDEDKTLYNIGISVIAAYVFYLFQVYIPEKARFRSYFDFSFHHRHEIYLLNQYLLAWEEFYNKDTRAFNFHEFVYFLNHNENGAVTRKTYEETIEELPANLLRIIQNSKFKECDLAYREFISTAYYEIKGHLSFMDDHFPRWSDEPISEKDLFTNYNNVQEIVLKDLKRIQNRLSSIEHYHLELERIEPYKESNLQKAAKEIFK